MAVSLEQFSTQLAVSTAMSTQELLSYIDSLPEADKPTNGEQLAKRLVKDKRLTAYQAQSIYSGKGKSLTMGSYFVLDKLGQGGMGMVVKAQHRMMKRLVAIKVLSPALTKTQDLQQRFQREVEAAARLTHPNIVSAFDAGEANGSPFLVMEYVPGDDLASIVRHKGPLSVDQAIDCIIQAARGLEFAHSQGVIHRDIKPANLLLDTKGVVKILDMGLARIDAADVSTQANLTGTGAVMGTVDYMAPEQAVSTKDADARSDLYSLGISLWYVLTGKPAYEGDSIMGRLLAHRDQPIPNLCAARSDVPESLNQVFQKLAAKKAGNRYQTAMELIADLERCRTGASVKAVAVAEAASGLDEFQNFLEAVEAPTEGVRSGKRTPPTKSVAQSSLLPTVTFAEETKRLLNVSNAHRFRRKRAIKWTSKAWYQDLRVQIGAGGVVLVIIGIVVLSQGGRRVIEPKPAKPAIVANEKPTKSASNSTTESPVESKPAVSSAVAESKKIPSNPKTAFSDPREAGADYELQGEYVGQLAGRDVGVQVISYGNGYFNAAIFPGGLPGAGWDAQQHLKYMLTGSTKSGTTRLTTGEFEAIVTPTLLTLKQGSIAGELKKVVRESPTMGAKAPEGALVLFDGTNTEQWTPGKMMEKSLMGIGTRTKEIFENYSLHLEFRTPFMPFASGQGRGNSGLYLGDQYELQILDSFGLEGADNECGGIYHNAKPLVNMCLPPLSWQTYDIEFACAKFGSDGKVKEPARVTVKHNGVVIHEELKLKTTPGGGRSDEKPGALFLQDHGDQVRFRNIWLVRK